MGQILAKKIPSEIHNWSTQWNASYKVYFENSYSCHFYFWQSLNFRDYIYPTTWNNQNKEAEYKEEPFSRR